MTLTDPIPYLVDPNQQEHRLLSPVIEIGRAVDNDIVITSKRVSREHACIRQTGHKWVLEDCNSANGTFLNGDRILDSMELRDGDHISIGGVILTYHDPDTTFRDDPFPELEVDDVAGVVRLNRRVITLSPKEFALLVYLEQRSGEVCSKDEISLAVWPEYQEAVYDYQIENLVRRLRTKIETDPKKPQLLLTIRGLGYKLIS